MNDFLIPALRDVDGDRCHSQQGLSKLRKLVRKDDGVKFDGRTCRRTYGQQAIDEVIPLDAVNHRLGHRTTKTMERYCCRRTNDSTIAIAKKSLGR